MNIYDQMLEDWTEDQWTQHTTNLQQQCIGGRLANQLGLGDRLIAAATTDEWTHLQDIIRQHTNNPYISVQQWNDDPARTFTDVQTILLIASVQWDLAHQPQETTV